MQANWSLILNVLLLIGVILAIGRVMKTRKMSLEPERHQPSLVQTEKKLYEAPLFNDDIIAVRKVSRDPFSETQIEPEEPVVKKTMHKNHHPSLVVKDEPKRRITDKAKVEAPSTLMMFLLAKENRQFAGYELLQTVLAAGLRFGEGHLFHRHQFANGQGPVLCSLAAATSTGIFDLQNIGAFSVRGLCLFMHTSGNPSVDEERFSIMLETARQLSDGMDAHLLDDHRKPLNEVGLARYYRLLKIEQVEVDFATA